MDVHAPLRREGEHRVGQYISVIGHQDQLRLQFGEEGHEFRILRSFRLVYVEPVIGGEGFYRSCAVSQPPPGGAVRPGYHRLEREAGAQ